MPKTIKKEKIIITIEIDYSNDSGKDFSFDEIFKKLKDGYREGFDSNETENYYFKCINQNIDEK